MKKNIIIPILAFIVVVAGVYAADKVFNIYGDYIEAPEPVEEVFGGAIAERWVDHSGLVTYVISGRFDSSITQSATIISFLNPFFNATNTDYTDAGNLSYLRTDVWDGATSTMDLAVITYDGTATSSFELECGSSVSYATAPTYDLINTLNYQLSQGSVDNSMATSQKALLDSTATTTGGAKAHIDGHQKPVILDSTYPFVVCNATSTSDDWPANGGDALIGGSSLLDGTFKFRIYKDQY